MNPLINAEIGMLYTTDSRFLAKIKYTRNPDSYTFIFSSLPESPLPKQVYLMPGEAPNDYTSFLCTTTGVFNEFYVPQTDRTWYLTETETLDLPDYRKEFRIDLSFPLTIVPQGTSKNTTISVVDISVGGLKFITDQEFQVDKTFSFIFTKGAEPVFHYRTHIEKISCKNSRRLLLRMPFSGSCPASRILCFAVSFSRKI